MSEKIYVRKVESWTVSAASKPIEVNVEALRNCEPPYEGNDNGELLDYLQEHVYNNYEWYENDVNIQAYGGEEAYELSMEYIEDMEEFFDSHEKGEDSFIQLGVPNEEYRKYGGFQPMTNRGL